MDQVNVINPAAGPAISSLPTMRTEVRALIALGCVPSPDEPWRIYTQRADTSFTFTSMKVWSAMHEMLSEAKS